MTVDQPREALPFDILFVGGGPANLAGAIHLMNLAAAKGIEIEVGLIEKGDTIGSHSLSGAILDPIALKELIPDYLDKGCPIEYSDCRDQFYYLTPTLNIAALFVPKYMHNNGCHIISPLPAPRSSTIRIVTRLTGLAPVIRGLTRPGQKNQITSRAWI